MMLPLNTFRMANLAPKTSSLKISWSRYEYLHSTFKRLLGTICNVTGNEDNQDRILPHSKTVSAEMLQKKAYSGSPSLQVPTLNTNLMKKKYPNLGQPTPFTHPHWFESVDEATPGITHGEYYLRRRNLMRELSKTEYGAKFTNHVVLLTASTVKTMSNDIPYIFHQDVDFLYLTGINEPDALVALEYNSTRDEINYLLFVKPKDPKVELWNGPCIGEEEAVTYFRADEAFPLTAFKQIVTDRFGSGDHCVWYRRSDKGRTRDDSVILNVVNSDTFRKAGDHVVEYVIQSLRLIKSEAEIRLLKKSASIACQAFSKVMRNTKAGIPESHLHALLEYVCKTQNAQFLSFPPVVANGNNATTLHYVSNTDLLRSGDLVLMDGGCELHGYASDITRAWPVSGTFSPAQKELYEIVLDVQEECFSAIKPGVTLNVLYATMLSALGRHLQELGFVSKDLSDYQLRQVATEYCPHHLGHYLGMDTHDTQLIHKGLHLKPGMVFTVEPGIYIPKHMTHVPEEYRGIGIRIEDDVLFTSEGPEVLTAELPKHVDDVERLLALGEDI